MSQTNIPAGLWRPNNTFGTLLFSPCVALVVKSLIEQLSSPSACSPLLFSPALWLLTLFPFHTLIRSSSLCCSVFFNLPLKPRFPSSLYPLSLSLCPSSSLLLLLCWSPPHSITTSPSLLSSFRHISLGSIHPASAFYEPNPFSHRVFTGLGAGIDLPLFVSPITRFLSLILCYWWLITFSPSFLIHPLDFLFFHLPFLSFLISPLFCLCVFSCMSNVFFRYTSSSHPFDPSSASLL